MRRGEVGEGKTKAAAAVAAASRDYGSPQPRGTAPGPEWPGPKALRGRDT